MAGAGYKLFVNGNTLSASDLNTYVQQQTVMVFATTGARDTALSSVLAEGMQCYITGTGGFYYNGSAWVANVSASSTTTFTNKSVTALIETSNVVASAATGTINVDALTSSVWYYTTSASANFTLNFRGNSGTSLATMLATGSAITIVFLNTNGATPYYPNVIQIDTSAVTPKWQGGTAPTGGNASAIDAWVFTIIKTAATPTYTVIASQTKFA